MNKENFKRIVIAAMLVFLCAATSGCVLAAIDKAKSIDDLSVPQIKALREANMDVYGCLTAGGPPAEGNLTIIIVPKDVSFSKFAFLPTCQIDMR